MALLDAFGDALAVEAVRTRQRTHREGGDDALSKREFKAILVDLGFSVSDISERCGSRMSAPCGMMTPPMSGMATCWRSQR